MDSARFQWSAFQIDAAFLGGNAWMNPAEILSQMPAMTATELTETTAGAICTRTAAQSSQAQVLSANCDPGLPSHHIQQDPDPLVRAETFDSGNKLGKWPL